MAGNSITLFGSDSPTGANAYVQEAFSDITDTPSNNSGWSSTVSSNPMNNLYGNDDFPRYGAKTLWIKDLVLEPNRINWINGEPTYRIIWNEPFPSAQGYVFGNIQLIRSADQTYVRVKSVGDGFGVGGVFSRCMFMMVGNTAAAGAATGTVSVDGVANSTTVDWSNLNSSVPTVDPMYAAFVHAGANETYQIHDFRLTAIQAGSVFTIAGVQVYSENPSLSIDQFPGVTYNNKTRSASSVNTTLALPAMGGSLGGVATIWKNQIGGYSMSIVGQTTMSSATIGSSGTNLVTVATGQGSSFAVGNGVIGYFGSTPYIGLVTNVSTDTLTVFPTLQIGVSSQLYRYFQSGPSLTINASLMQLAYTFGSTDFMRTQMTSGSTGFYNDPYQNFYVWGNGIGITLMDNSTPVLAFTPTTGYLQCEGYFSAAEIEFAGMSMAFLHGTLAVNGFNSFNFNAVGATGVFKRTVFSEAGPGWNSFAFTAGATMTSGIARINLYRRARDISASYGILASMDVLQAFNTRTAGQTLNPGATLITPGLFKRTYADQILFRGPWVRSIGGATIPGTIAYSGSTTTCTATFNYFGTAFSVLGMSQGVGGSMQISLDAGANQGCTSMGAIIGLGSSNTFHSASLAVLGGTQMIFGIDHYRTFGEMKNLQTFYGVTNSIGTVNAGAIVTTGWQYYIPGTTGMGTISNVALRWRRVGPDMEIKGSFLMGAISANSAYIFLPNSNVADGSVNSPLSANSGVTLMPELVGTWQPGAGSVGASLMLGTPLGILPYDNKMGLYEWGCGSNIFEITNLGNIITQSNGALFVNAKVPIAGWYWDH